MSADYLQGNQPDILEVIANLSNDAVFTPPKVVNAVLDLLPRDVWSNPALRWLDPGAKTGVFPREITKRLMVGLAEEMPDEDTRLHHILTNMIFAIATEEITGMMTRRSLYCSKDASGTFSVAPFDTADGNVWHKRVKHAWDGNGKCTECKGSHGELEITGRDNKAYGFIHANGRKQLEKEMNMEFDVIVGNPPYQMESDGGTRTIPIYNIFVEEAKKLAPRYMALVIPSRWMAGGLGLDAFRADMLGDHRVSKLVDFPDASEVFPGVEIKGGVCYFLWDREHRGSCEVTLLRSGEVTGPVKRKLDEYDVFVRDVAAVVILKKVLAFSEPPLTEIMTTNNEFGIGTNYNDYEAKGGKNFVRLHLVTNGQRQEGWIPRSDIPKGEASVDMWKVIVPKSYGAGETWPHQILGQPIISKPPSAFTQTFVGINVATETEAKSVESYLRTRFFRFMVSLRKISQHAPKPTYVWVPMQKWNRTWTDAELYAKYDISADEQAYIESMVKEMPA